MYRKYVIKGSSPIYMYMHAKEFLIPHDTQPIPNRAKLLFFRAFCFSQDKTEPAGQTE
jgi:hypothetical protein